MVALQASVSASWRYGSPQVANTPANKKRESVDGVETLSRRSRSQITRLARQLRYRSLTLPAERCGVFYRSD
jgi:hypothetical protein